MTVSQQPKLLPLYRSMTEAVVSTMPRARCFETVLENVFNGIEQELSLPPPQEQVNLQPNSKQLVEMQKNILKNKELNIKAKIEADKLAFADKELSVQSRLKQCQLQAEKV